MICQSRGSGQRGAITIQVAFALMALIVFSSIVVDNGVMYVARRQAQTAADAGALAGAQTLMNTPTNLTLATQAATYFAGQNAIWGQQTAPSDIVVSPLPFNCPDGVPACIRVDVMRGLPDRSGTPHGNTMPTYFMSLVGMDTQGVRATATAQVGAGNALSCIKPWMVADKWVDNSPPSATNPAGWDQTDTFDTGIDTYSKPGFSAATDIGLQLMLKGEGRDFSAGWSLEIDLNGGNGGNVYSDEISTCPDYVPTIGLYAAGTPCNGPTDVNYEKGCLNVKTGVKQGPTVQGVADLIAADPGATWDSSTNSVTGGCTSAGTCSNVNLTGESISPRIIPIALFDPQSYVDLGCNGGNPCMARVTNLLGFFLEGMCSDVYATPPPWCGTGGDPNKTVVGRLMPYPGSSKSGSGSAGPETFVKTIRLIR
jgi:Putative Flp pilus-assembly TadE/G-like